MSSDSSTFSFSPDGKKVLIRVDFNVPLNDAFQITDDTRIQAALPTLRYILDNGGSAIIMSHLGRPGKKLLPDGSIDRERFTLKHLSGHLSDLLGTEVHFSPETVGETASKMAAALQPGQVLLLENTRFNAGEKKGDAAFAEQLAALGDIYVNDAFGTAHREHASTATVARFFAPAERHFGQLMQREVENASRVLNSPEAPVVAIVGGAKVSDKILLLEQLLDLANTIIVGGAMAYTFWKAKGGQVGNSLVEDDKLDLASELMAKAEEKGVQLLLPEDSIIAEAFDNDAAHKAAPSDSITTGWMGLDIGPDARKAFAAALQGAKTILWNGPMGVFEMSNYANGTKSIALAVAEATKHGAFSLIGGGDSVAAVKQMDLADEVSFVSTGGGAMLEFLEGKKLPGVAAVEG